MKIIYKPSAINSINSITDYISEVVLMPETGRKYSKKMFEFIDLIAETPAAYSICKYPNWKIKNLQCATFNKIWVIAYKIIANNLVIYFIKNGKLLNY